MKRLILGTLIVPTLLLAAGSPARALGSGAGSEPDVAVDFSDGDGPVGVEAGAAGGDQGVDFGADPFSATASGPLETFEPDAAGAGWGDWGTTDTSSGRRWLDDNQQPVAFAGGVEGTGAAPEEEADATLSWTNRGLDAVKFGLGPASWLANKAWGWMGFDPGGAITHAQVEAAKAIQKADQAAGSVLDDPVEPGTPRWREEAQGTKKDRTFDDWMLVDRSHTRFDHELADGRTYTFGLPSDAPDGSEYRVYSKPVYDERGNERGTRYMVHVRKWDEEKEAWSFQRDYEMKVQRYRWIFSRFDYGVLEPM